MKEPLPGVMYSILEEEGVTAGVGAAVLAGLVFVVSFDAIVAFPSVETTFPALPAGVVLEGLRTLFGGRRR